MPDPLTPADRAELRRLAEAAGVSVAAVESTSAAAGLDPGIAFVTAGRCSAQVHWLPREYPHVIHYVAEAANALPGTLDALDAAEADRDRLRQAIRDVLPYLADVLRATLLTAMELPGEER